MSHPFHVSLDRIRDEFITGERFVAACDHIFWEDAFDAKPVDPAFPAGGVVFCKIDRVWECLGQLVRTDRRIVLVTGQGDYPIDFSRAVEAPKNVEMWFGPNAIEHDGLRIQSLPLGLGSPAKTDTLHAGDIAKALAEDRPRTHRLYVNFRPDTHPEIRQPIYDYFAACAGESWITFQPPAKRGENHSYLNELIRHQFVICPPGFGVDTHRMWEALYAGAIPVVQNSPAMVAFHDLPILFVDAFSEVTEDSLRSAAERIRAKTWNLDALFMPYWITMIADARNKVQKCPRLNLVERSGVFTRAAIRRCLPTSLKQSKVLWSRHTN